MTQKLYLKASLCAFFALNTSPVLASGFGSLSGDLTKYITNFSSPGTVSRLSRINTTCHDDLKIKTWHFLETRTENEILDVLKKFNPHQQLSFSQRPQTIERIKEFGEGFWKSFFTISDDTSYSIEEKSKILTLICQETIDLSNPSWKEEAFLSPLMVSLFNRKNLLDFLLKDEDSLIQKKKKTELRWKYDLYQVIKEAIENNDDSVKNQIVEALRDLGANAARKAWGWICFAQEDQEYALDIAPRLEELNPRKAMQIYRSIFSKNQSLNEDKFDAALGLYKLSQIHGFDPNDREKISSFMENVIVDHERNLEQKYQAVLLLKDFSFETAVSYINVIKQMGFITKNLSRKYEAASLLKGRDAFDIYHSILADPSFGPEEKSKASLPYLEFALSKDFLTQEECGIIISLSNFRDDIPQPLIKKLLRKIVLSQSHDHDRYQAIDKLKTLGYLDVLEEIATNTNLYKSIRAHAALTLPQNIPLMDALSKDPTLDAAHRFMMAKNLGNEAVQRCVDIFDHEKTDSQVKTQIINWLVEKGIFDAKDVEETEHFIYSDEDTDDEEDKENVNTNTPKNSKKRKRLGSVDMKKSHKRLFGS